MCGSEKKAFKPVHRVEPLVSISSVSHFKAVKKIYIGYACVFCNAHTTAQFLILLIRHEEHEGIQHSPKVPLCERSNMIVIKLVKSSTQSLVM